MSTARSPRPVGLSIWIPPLQAWRSWEGHARLLSQGKTPLVGLACAERPGFWSGVVLVPPPFQLRLGASDCGLDLAFCFLPPVQNGTLSTSFCNTRGHIPTQFHAFFVVIFCIWVFEGHLECTLGFWFEGVLYFVWGGVWSQMKYCQWILFCATDRKPHHLFTVPQMGSRQKGIGKKVTKKGGKPWKCKSCLSNRFLRLRNTLKHSVFEGSKLVSTKTLELKHYYRRQGKRLPKSDRKREKRLPKKWPNKRVSGLPPFAYPLLRHVD